MSHYDSFARFYDLEHQDLPDMELYHNFAIRCNGPILELGCGAGRTSLALTKAGHDVTGIDNSTAMLSLAQSHAAKAGLTERIRFEYGDVRTCSFEPRFALAIYPLNGFLHLATRKEQKSTLHNIYRALLPGGFLIIDLPNPHTVCTTQIDGQLVLRRRFQSPEGNTICSLSSTQTDLAAQTQQTTLFYDEVDNTGTVHRTTVEMSLRFVYCYEMIGLLEQTGFQVDAVYGSYDLDPYESDSPEMLFVAYKPLQE